MCYNMNTIKFSKYHGCGNDFIIVKENEVSGIKNIKHLITRICNRHTGVGADGFIIAKSNPLAMDFYNQDGSTASMCGNGIRALGAFMFDEKMVENPSFVIETLAGNIEMRLLQKPNYLFQVILNEYSFDSSKLAIDTTKSTFLSQEMMYHDFSFSVSAVQIGSKHLVIFVDDLKAITKDLGEFFSQHHLFKDQINVDFVEQIDYEHFKLKTYERGVGFTKACGTGACASLIIGNYLHKCGNTVNVIMELGTLKVIKYHNKIIMEGPAQKICDGIYLLEDEK